MIVYDVDLRIVVELCYLCRNYCLHNRLGIDKDLGRDFAVINGNGMVTVISFTSAVPTPLAFFHAFVMFCNQKKLINREAYWITIKRTDRPAMP